jgi:hypothetical protein
MFAPRFSIIQGKPTPRARLCDTCINGVVMSGAQQDQEEVFCLLIARHTQIDVVSCNRYVQRDIGPCSAAWANETAWVA